MSQGLEIPKGCPHHDTVQTDTPVTSAMMLLEPLLEKYKKFAYLKLLGIST